MPVAVELALMVAFLLCPSP